jgi:hypothetical protein
MELSVSCAADAMSLAARTLAVSAATAEARTWMASDMRRCMGGANLLAVSASSSWFNASRCRFG